MQTPRAGPARSDSLTSTSDSPASWRTHVGGPMRQNDDAPPGRGPKERGGGAIAGARERDTPRVLEVMQLLAAAEATIAVRRRTDSHPEASLDGSAGEGARSHHEVTRQVAVFARAPRPTDTRPRRFTMPLERRSVAPRVRLALGAVLA